VPRRRALARCTCGLQRFQCGTLAWHGISPEPCPLGGLLFQGSLVYGTATMLTGSRATVPHIGSASPSCRRGVLWVITCFLRTSSKGRCAPNASLKTCREAGALTGIKMAYPFPICLPGHLFSFFVGRVDLRHHHLRPLRRVALAAGRQVAPVGRRARFALPSGNRRASLALVQHRVPRSAHGPELAVALLARISSTISGGAADDARQAERPGRAPAAHRQRATTVRWGTKAGLI
jgi:hypothetical protein